MKWREVEHGHPTGIAVVGAGVGGCYTAYRLAGTAALASVPHGSPVTLYERTHRTGGRIWSVGLNAGCGGWAELGAMRLHRQATSVMDLLDHIGLSASLVPFAFGRDENLAHVRGALLRQRQLHDAEADLPYRLRPAERGRGPDALELSAIEKAIPGFGRLRDAYHRAAQDGQGSQARLHTHTYRAMRDVATVHGQPLHKTSWNTVLEAALSSEATQFINDTAGYDIHSGNASAWIDTLFHTPPQAEYVTLSNGMQSLPTALHTAFQSAGGTTRLGHRLCRIERTEPSARTPRRAPVYTLTFALEDRAGRDTGERVQTRAHTVVLALPQGALRQLEGTTRLCTPRLRRDLDAVEAVPALKLFLAYAEPWWRKHGLTLGRSTTDTPLRHLWYGGTTPQPETEGNAGSGGNAGTNGPALLLAAYPNGPSAAYWNRFCDGPRYTGDGKFHTFHETAPRPSVALVEHAHELLCAMHRTRTPPPVAACWQNWNHAPHAGAWHLWRPDRHPETIAARMRNPAPGEAVHIVSDCWTSDPGSIPGVLDSAERVLQDHFGLAPPPWHRRPTP
ncbi:flavin monoamine oxidase family protein [Streptomyces sp. NPDC052236]|uniref:flavin monoamine oxidase family protein n=1 Tax=Streptomyces sp. NPDC052236 TaxID=3365686 RepID=UPI0037D7E9C1